MNSDEKERLRAILRGLVRYGTITDFGLKETLFVLINILFDEPEKKVDAYPEFFPHATMPDTAMVVLSDKEIVPLMKLIEVYEWYKKEAGL